ncbi:hypothetical protein L198_05549 [Cryptococcus wingfieldii CBS 7118]|uniref:TauD/TfdA-like domain-containing protein n=1 Tax=Cryptococcus wingfieldii CBS 7118 TaxID=1295528 RepID=A0A1E3IWF0_9TREE|nr:hypothetical protein L198_05549 [Cryptococcus wingfieldii CBS 7118]ODN92755.1 hypothetical protein L198_05549 [Cryptococcus wingfieldii CBS 7118]
MLTTQTRTYPTVSSGILRLKSDPSHVVGQLLVTPILTHADSFFGAEVSGVDWSQTIPESLVKELVALQDKYGVLVFRKTGMDNTRHIAFSHQLGSKLEVNPFYYGKENDRVREDYLWDVGNMELDGSPVRPESRRWHHSLGNCLWHTAKRSKYSLLLSHGNPVQGGSWTHFADTRQAYADLPEEKKAMLEDLIIEHEQTGPDGRKVLYLAAHAKQVVGWDLEKSQKLIWELIDWCTQPKYVFSMEWHDGGDMVWWDNRQSMHRANPYTANMTARDVRRATVIDDGPLAFGVTAEEVKDAESKA